MKKRAAELLNDLKIKQAKPRETVYTLLDGKGLQILVHPNGSKYFQFRTTLNGKPKLIQLGSYPTLSLSEARKLAGEKRKQVKVDNLDPILLSKLEKARKVDDANNTFRKIAEDWLLIKKHTLAPTTHLKIQQTFNANVYGVLGKLPISSINNRQVRNCLLIMQERGALELMEKTRGWIRQVFDFALSDNILSENPIPAKDERLLRHVSTRFPRLKSLQDAGILFKNLSEYPGNFEVMACVYLQIHLARRPSELRCAEWSEFDFEKKIWTIPLSRIKTRKFLDKPHTVMLSKQVIGMLEKLQKYTGHSIYLFSARLQDKPVSEATIRKAFRTVFPNYPIVPHGCRHFLSTQANESGLFRGDVIESFISHKDKDKIRATYNEATYDLERRELAQWWSDELEKTLHTI